MERLKQASPIYQVIFKVDLVDKFSILQVQELDVASLSSIRSFSNHWVDSGRKIDCLINNAGIFSILGEVQLDSI